MDEARDRQHEAPPPRRERVAPNYHKRKHTWRNVIIVVIILGLAGGGYWFLYRDKSGESAKKTETSNTENPPSQTEAPTKQYSSQNFALEFDHPIDWKVTDVAGSGRLTVRSPTMQLTDDGGQKVNGQVVMTIRNKQQPLPEFDKGNAIAAIESEKVAYTKPSQTQRGSTYLSFLRYASTVASSGIDGIFITGDFGYQKDQAIPKADIAPVDPVISVTFVKCKDKECSGEPTPLTISENSWNNTGFSKPIKTMLQSLTIT